MSNNFRFFTSLGLIAILIASGNGVILQQADAEFVINNIGLSSFNIQVDDNLVAFSVSEFDQGQDLNRDEDTDDIVLHIYDHSTGETTNSELDASLAAVDGNLLVVKVGGDTSDNILHIYDHSTGETTNLGLSGSNIGVDGNLVAFYVDESSQGEDLNGDGDTSDDILHIYDHSTGETTNLGLSGFVRAIDGNLVAFTVIESSQGEDLNGDGDIEFSDQILHIYDHSTGETTNLELAGRISSIDGILVGFSVFEESQGNTDLNNDEDADDIVLHIYDHSTGTITNLELD